MPNRSYVLVLNWNGWADTLNCLESLLRSEGFDARIVVWDNGSTDQSVARMEAWATGAIDATTTVPPALRRFVSPPAQKPIDFETLDPDELGRGAALTIVRGRRNLGYAGGNNAAVRWALLHDDCAYVWILNNDTVVAEDSGAQMLAAAQDDPFDRPVGASIFYLDEPQRLQACGGQRVGWGPVVAPRYVDRVEDIDYLTGVSLFMSRSCAQALGGFNEDYFLNAEDLELTYSHKLRFVRSHPGHSAFLVAGKIWHRESSTQSRNRYLHVYYYTRNVLYAARRIGRIHAAATLLHAYSRVLLAAMRARPAAVRGIVHGIADYHAGIVGMHPDAQK